MKTPIRMCFVCRKRENQSALLRILQQTVELAVGEAKGRNFGRSVYLHNSCIEQFEKKVVKYKKVLCSSLRCKRGFTDVQINTFIEYLKSSS
jgi:predicted RNA-binding protein YlxR (DUF448 family)